MVSVEDGRSGSPDREDGFVEGSVGSGEGRDGNITR